MLTRSSGEGVQNMPRMVSIMCWLDVSRCAELSKRGAYTYISIEPYKALFVSAYMSDLSEPGDLEALYVCAQATSE